MEVDLAVFLAAILENEGGKYVLPIEAFETVMGGQDNRAIAFDPTDGGKTITFSLVDASEVPQEDAGE